MKKTTITLCSLLISIMSLAQSWLPQEVNRERTIRPLGCKYNDAKLVESNIITSTSTDWEVSIKEKKINAETIKYTYIFKAKCNQENTGVALAFDEYDWTSDNFVMIPAIVYNGNRQRIVNRQYATGFDQTDYYRKDLALTSNPIPQLSPEYGGKSRLEVNISNTSTPVITYLNRHSKKGTFLFTDQGIKWEDEIKDHALIAEESPSRSIASFIVSAPGVREYKPEFIGFSKSLDRGISVKTGDEISISVTKVDFNCADVPTLYNRFFLERKQHTIAEKPRNLMPMSEVSNRMIKNIDSRYFIGNNVEFYCPENADWMSYGWIGGLMNTHPIIALGDKDHLQKALNTLDFGLMHGSGKSGFFYDVVGNDGKVINRDAAALVPNIAITRRNADVLYWVIKQFMLLESQGNGQFIKNAWKQVIRSMADAFTKTWRENHTWGNYINVESGKVAVYNSSSGVMAVAGLALASQYFNEPDYLEIAQQASDDFYNNFKVIGFTSGACGDILQNADSETAIAFATSLITMYETTGQFKYLEQAQNVVHYTSSWTVSFPYVLPKDTPLAKLGANLTGAVWASTQNKHGAPGFCTQSGDVLFKLYRITGNELYADFMRDVIHAHAEGVQPNGRITERLTYCDADSRGSRGDGGYTGWNETNGAMMATELPGIYVRKDLGKAFIFDHLELNKLEKQGKQITLTLYNPTLFDAVVTIFAEDAQEASKALGENAFVNWKQKVNVKAGKTIKVKIK